MRTAIGIIALLALVGILWTAIASNLRANRFFPELIARYPVFANAFPAPGMNTRYGPIWPSYMRFLKKKSHLELPDPDLRSQGTHLHMPRLNRYQQVHGFLSSLSVFLPAGAEYRMSIFPSHHGCEPLRQDSTPFL